MLILLALVFAAAAGLALHFLLPLRGVRGAALGPLAATAVAAVLYTSLTWLGIGEDNPWLWVVSLAVPVAVTWVLLLVVSRTRVTHDARERARLRI